MSRSARGRARQGAIGLGVAIVVVSLATTAWATGSVFGVNGRSGHAAGVIGAPGRPIGCEIQDPNGQPTDSVAVANQPYKSYWLAYLNDGSVASTKVTFTVTPVDHPNDPLRSQKQVFDTSASPGTSILTPFGIPFWKGHKTSGTYRLTVSDDRGKSATCTFKVG